MPTDKGEMEEYSAMLTTLMSDYPEYREMTLGEVAEEFGAADEGDPIPVDEELENAELIPDMPELAPAEEDEEAMFI